LARLREQLADPQQPLKERRRALAILKRVGDRQSSNVYLKLLDVPELRTEAMTLLAATGDPAGASELIQRLPAWNAAERDAAINTLTSRVNYAVPFLKQIAAGKLDKQLLSALYVRRMSDLANPDIDALLEKVWGKVGATDESTKALIAKLRKTYTTAPLWAFDAHDGAKIFTKNCATCHPTDGTTPLGPNLKGTAKNGLDYFLENIVDPNAVVGETFRTTLIETKSGTIVSGLLDTETETAVVLRTAEKTITVPKAEIENRRLAHQSLMPTGLLDKLSETEVIELLKFLTEKL
jgi:putative heme-binding domain-containing protein